MTGPASPTNNLDGQSKWIAFEIHDGLLPWVTGALMQVSGLHVTPESQNMQQIAVHCLKHAVAEGRALIAYLESQADRVNLDLSHDIHALINNLAPLIHKAGQSISSEIQLNSQHQLSAQQIWVILRVVQQALQNVIQHAGPAKIHVCVQQLEEQLIVEISDSGVGFCKTELQTAGFGLNSMNERARAIDGYVEVNSQPNSGTVVRMTVPLSIRSSSS